MAAPAHSTGTDAGRHAIGGEDLLRWRRQQLSRGGQPSGLDWLLDLEAGVDWQQLQQLRRWEPGISFSGSSNVSPCEHGR